MKLVRVELPSGLPHKSSNSKEKLSKDLGRAMDGSEQPRVDDISTLMSPTMNKRSNHRWTPTEDEILVRGCLELINHGWRADNGFKSGYCLALEKMIREKIPGSKIKGDPHIKSRMKTLKTRYKEVKEMRGQAGFTWDDYWKCLNCNDDVWFSWIENHKDAAGLRNKPIPFYDELAVVFERDQQQGEGDKCAVKPVQVLDKAETDKELERNDSFRADLELANINEMVSVSDNVCSESSDSGAKRTPEQTQPEPNSNLHPKTRKRKATSSGESSDESINSCILRLVDICDATRAEIGRMAREIGKVAKYMEHLSENVPNKPLLFETISAIDGLTPDEVVQAYGVISAHKEKSKAFLCLPDEATRRMYVNAILRRLI